MDTLENVLAAWEKDCDLDQTEPGKELLRIPSLHSKYLKALVKTKMALKKSKNELAEMKKIRWNYYSGNYNTNKEMLTELGLEPFKFILKQDISIYLEADKDVIKLTDKIHYYEEMGKALEAILVELKQRTWNLKTFVDWEKFVTGV